MHPTQDSAACQRRRFATFKATLTRRINRKDWHGVIDLWADFQAYYNDRNLPWPDDWRRWERAADDATFELRRQSWGVPDAWAKLRGEEEP